MKKYISIFCISITITLNAQDFNKTVENNNQFAFDLLEQLDHGKNQIVSPFSISTAIGMTYAGACNETEKQISDVFHFYDNNNIHSDFLNIYKTINNKYYKETKLRFANSLWTQQDYKFLDKFINLNKNNYGSSVFNTDFKKHTEKSRKEINNWVSKITEEKIPELIQPGILNPLTRMVLVNAVYLKTPWVHKFKKANNYTDTFYEKRFKKHKAEFMTNTFSTKYYEDRDFKILELPYENHNISMIIFLPTRIVQEKKLAAKFNFKYYSNIITKLKRQKIEIHLPKFSYRTNLGLKDHLSKMGMPIAFGNKADFSGMSGNLELRIQEVIHEAFIDVNENGTEAAAATAVVMRMKSSFNPEDPILFKADHTFYYIIKDNKTGSILFMGKLLKPEKKNK